jgi:drug/metabolite transporter (DMT)-like permease
MAVVALLLLSIIWGYSWVFLKIGLRDAGPFTYAGLRTLIGALSILAVLKLTGRPVGIARGRELFMLGLFNTAGAVGCSSWVLVEAAANRTSILMFTMPFWTVLIAWPVLRERIGGAQWLAVILAASGLVSILYPWQLGEQVVSTGIVICASLCWATGAIMMKRILARQPMDLLVLTAWQMTFGSLILVAISVIAGEPTVIWTPRFIGALIATSLVSTAFGQVLWVYLLHKLPAGTASMMTLLVPVVAVASTSFHLGETLAVQDALGVALIVGGLTVLTFHAVQQHRTATGGAAPE